MSDNLLASFGSLCIVGTVTIKCTTHGIYRSVFFILHNSELNYKGKNTYQLFFHKYNFCASMVSFFILTFCRDGKLPTFCVLVNFVTLHSGKHVVLQRLSNHYFLVAV